ncbi:MAG TPA: CapA family protein [Bacilli bacterium]
MRSKTVLGERSPFPRLAALLLLSAGLMLASCQEAQQDRNQAAQPGVSPPFAASATPAATATPAPQPSPYSLEATLIAVGDIMMHSRETQAGYDAATKTYNFTHFFAKVKDELAKGDWVTGNLETPLADHDPRGYTGYPEFNAPPELADALKDAGFNVITTANNHSLDRREYGILRTIANLRARGLVEKGVAASPEDAEQSVIVSKNGISMAFLAYTYGTNGIPIPKGKPYLVPLIDEEKMKADIAREKRNGADLVTVAVHFGDEYHLQPNDLQKKLAHELFLSGADIILGSHPHVVQPYELLNATDAAGRKRTGVVIYSLGNFISDQDRTNALHAPTDTGVIFAVHVRKMMPENITEITGVEYKPTYVQRYRENGKLQFRVLPMEAALAYKDDPYLQAKDLARLNRYLREMNEQISAIERGRSLFSPANK